MPIRSFLFYVRAKQNDKLQWQNYIADCLWVQAVGSVFRENNNPAYPQWREIINPQKTQVVKHITKDDIKAQFKRLKKV